MRNTPAGDVKAADAFFLRVFPAARSPYKGDHGGGPAGHDDGEGQRENDEEGDLWMGHLKFSCDESGNTILEGHWENQSYVYFTQSWD
jgi:hypothetical protein